MEQFNNYQQRMYYLMFFMCAVISLVLFFLLPTDPSWFLGFMLGSVGQLAKYKLIDVAVIKKLASVPENATKYQLQASFKSFLLIILVFIIAIIFKARVNIWTVVAGFFIPRIILVLDGILRPNPFAKQAKNKPSTANLELGDKADDT